MSTTAHDIMDAILRNELPDELFYGACVHRGSGETGEVWLQDGTRAEITVRVTREGAGVVCAFCGDDAGADYHLIGASGPGDNPYCCDECWDERLR